MYGTRPFMVILKDMMNIENSEKISLLTCHGKVMIKMIHVYKEERQNPEKRPKEKGKE
jgi:hypothetical protein